MSTIVITGSSAGIGKAAATALAKLGHEVAVVGRNPQRTHDVAAAIGGEPFLADFDRIEEVRALAAALLERYPRIDVLANNAGELVAKRSRTVDGYEHTWQRNVLAPFILTTELLPRLTASGGRVIFTGSEAQSWAAVHPTNPNREGLPWLRGWPAYGASKRADIMLAKEFARREQVEAYSFHPGFVATSFAALDRTPIAGLISRVAKTPEEGAAPMVLLATSEDLGVPGGTYFDGLHPNGKLAAQAEDPAEWAKLWNALERQASKLS